MAASLDCVEQQVCVECPLDPNFTWHHRVMLRRLGQGLWVVLTPDLSVERADLNTVQFIPVTRNAAMPARVLGDVCQFVRLTEQELRAAHQEAAALVDLMGGGAIAAAVPVNAEWVFSDPSHRLYGSPVPTALLANPAASITRGSVGLVDHDQASWATMERVMLSDIEDWKEEKRSGPGRDPRVLPIVRDAGGERFASFRESLGGVVEDAPRPADWIFRGPGATLELMRGVRAAGEDLSGYHEYYVRSSGMSGEGPVAHKHRELISILFLMNAFDQLNVPHLASAELVSRLILQIHQAVMKCPKNLDFRRFSMMTISKLDSSGGVLTGDFAKYVAEEQKSEAFTLKQTRLYAEEQENREKEKTTGKHPKTPKGGSKGE